MISHNRLKDIFLSGSSEDIIFVVQIFINSGGKPDRLIRLFNLLDIDCYHDSNNKFHHHCNEGRIYGIFEDELVFYRSNDIKTNGEIPWIKLMGWVYKDNSLNNDTTT